MRATQAHGQGRGHERRLPLGERRSVAVGERAATTRTTTFCGRSATRRDSRASEWRTPIASLAATTIASPTSTAASCSATCTRARSSTRRATTRRAARFANAPLWEAILARNGKRFGFRYTMTGIDERFPYAQRLHLAPRHRARRDRPSGDVVQRARHLLETLTGDILFDDTWQYSHLVHRGDAQDKKFHLSGERRSARRLDARRRRLLGDVRLGQAAVSATTRSSAPSARRSTLSRSPASGASRTATTSLTLRRRSGRSSTRRCCTSAARTRTSSSGRRPTSTTCADGELAADDHFASPATLSTRTTGAAPTTASPAATRFRA